MNKIDQSWTIKQITETYPPHSWEKVFEETKSDIKHISKKLDDEKVFGNYYPYKEDIFNAFKYCKLDDIKVVIIGIEPYSTLTYFNNKQVPKDTGVAYSLRRTDQVNKIINNIYTELKNEYSDFIIPEHGDLTGWCEQGVLLLN